jgi:hypothetical protein
MRQSEEAARLEPTPFPVHRSDGFGWLRLAACRIRLMNRAVVVGRAEEVERTTRVVVGETKPYRPNGVFKAAREREGVQHQRLPRRPRATTLLKIKAGDVERLRCGKRDGEPGAAHLERHRLRRDSERQRSFTSSET